MKNGTLNAHLAPYSGALMVKLETAPTSEH